MPEKTKGRDLLTLLHRHGHALKETLSGTPEWACLRAPSFESKLSVSWRTAAEATRIVFCKTFSGRFVFPNAERIMEMARSRQARRFLPPYRGWRLFWTVKPGRRSVLAYGHHSMLRYSISGFQPLRIELGTPIIPCALHVPTLIFPSLKPKHKHLMAGEMRPFELTESLCCWPS